ncbi:Tyrosine--tRNA ligase [Candidatus Portiera aleyrodidarum]|uniref:tyrosine--tRNA ligase n=1 Tax=Candidatus Portiera aleyrodidarum TaxID=91844 RepID=UPI0005D8E013|nr:tyrosine--tRNA ligase [Candidatus Portiera aleyrodidarum]CEL12277.1 Tyrosine--tRNA ligase [Candidatus Portiera aleyrodidarum]
MKNIKNILKKIKLNTKKILIEKFLIKKIKSGKILNIKIGLDPTSPNLHLGHFVLIKKLKQLQDLGHKILFIIGDFTGIIGDPTGKNLTRKSLTKEQIKINAIKCKKQILKIFNPKKIKILFNSEWLKKISILKIIKILSKVTISKMLERKDFNKRYKTGYSISIHEFIYPLIQAYDSVVLKADIEVGGIDQIFNFLIGRELQKVFNQEPQNLITMPILEGSDGKKKMSKTLNNYININDKPGDLYRKIISINDNLIYKYFKLLSTKPINNFIKIQNLNPRKLKFKLATELITYFYNKNIAKKASTLIGNKFLNNLFPINIPKIKLIIKKFIKVPIIYILNKSGLVKNNSQAKDLLKNKKIKINNIFIKKNYKLIFNKIYLIQAGNKNFAIIKLLGP